MSRENCETAKIFRTLAGVMRVKLCMKAHSLTLSIAAVVGAFALFATSAEAGGRKKYHRHHDDDDDRYYRGGRNDYGYYQRQYYRPRHYYQPVRYIEAPYYNRGPAFQIGFAFGGGRHCR